MAYNCLVGKDELKCTGKPMQITHLIQFYKVLLKFENAYSRGRMTGKKLVLPTKVHKQTSILDLYRRN